ncbi:Holo-[acyl-carrier protein]synthase, partial [Mycoplasmopsis synoviae]
MNLGVDLVTISRFKNKNKEFIERLLSEEEFVEFNKLDNEESKELFLARSW